LTIGGDALYGQYFAGRIDEVRIYNRALSAAEIQTDMNAPLSDGFAAASSGPLFSSTSSSPGKLAIIGRLENGSVILRVDGVAGFQYQIEVSEDLATWTPVGAVSSASGTSVFTVGEAAAHSRRFYRVRENP
jgi:hypothetical protein